MKHHTFFIFALAAILAAGSCKQETVREEAAISGAYPLLVTPYTEDGNLDLAVLVREAQFVDREGASGIIWPTAGEIEVLDSLGEYQAGLQALAELWSKGGMNSRLTPVVCGRTVESALERAALWDKLAGKCQIKASLLCRQPDNIWTEEQTEDYFVKLASVTSLPVIIQSYNTFSPQPSVELLVRLAKDYPDTYGYVKEESSQQYVTDVRMQGLQDGRPYIKTIIAGSGAYGLLHQGEAYGACGAITQKPDCTRLLAKMCERAAAGADASDPEFADAFGKMLIVGNMNKHFESKELFRGPHLVLLKELGVFTNTYTRKIAADGSVTLDEFKVDDKHLEYIRSIKALIYGE